MDDQFLSLSVKDDHKSVVCLGWHLGKEDDSHPRQGKWFLPSGINIIEKGEDGFCYLGLMLSKKKKCSWFVINDWRFLCYLGNYYRWVKSRYLIAGKGQVRELFCPDYCWGESESLNESAKVQCHFIPYHILAWDGDQVFVPWNPPPRHLPCSNVLHAWVVVRRTLQQRMQTMVSATLYSENAGDVMKFIGSGSMSLPVHAHGKNTRNTACNSNRACYHHIPSFTSELIMWKQVLHAPMSCQSLDTIYVINCINEATVTIGLL